MKLNTDDPFDMNKLALNAEQIRACSVSEKIGSETETPVANEVRHAAI